MTPSIYTKCSAPDLVIASEWLTLYLAQHRAVIIPDDAKLHRNLLRWYGAGRWISPNFWITPGRGGKLVSLIMKMRV